MPPPPPRPPPTAPPPPPRDAGARDAGAGAHVAVVAAWVARPPARPLAPLPPRAPPPPPRSPTRHVSRSLPLIAELLKQNRRDALWLSVAPAVAAALARRRPSRCSSAAPSRCCGCAKPSIAPALDAVLPSLAPADATTGAMAKGGATRRRRPTR